MNNDDLRITNANGEKVRLVSDFVHLIGYVPVGSVLVSENIFTGKTRVSSGLSAVIPFSKRKVICITRLYLTIDFDDTLNNSENLELTIKPVTIHFHVDTMVNKKEERENKKDVESGAQKFYKQRNSAMILIEQLIRQLVVKIVKVFNYQKLKGLRISPANINGLFYGNKSSDSIEDLKNDIVNTIKSIRLNYGVVIDEILFSDINLPKEITDAQAAARSAEINNITLVKNARAEKEAAELKAAAAKVMACIDYDAIYDFVQKTKLDKQQICDIIKRYLIQKGNATFIETNGTGDYLMPYLYSAYQANAQMREKQAISMSDDDILSDSDSYVKKVN